MQKIHGTKAENSVTLSEQTGFMRESLDVSLSDHKIAEMVSELNKGDVPSEEADVDAALQAALEADDDVDAVVTAINTHAAHATPEPLGRAREERNEKKFRGRDRQRMSSSHDECCLDAITTIVMTYPQALNLALLQYMYGS